MALFYNKQVRLYGVMAAHGSTEAKIGVRIPVESFLQFLLCAPTSRILKFTYIRYY